jgi:hypothetical protein
MGALSINPLLAAPAGMLFVVPFGIIVGAILGIAAGTLLGVLEGLLLCALTYFFLKTKNAVAYRRSARISGAILSVAILVTAWALLGFKPNAFAGGGGPPGAFSGIGVADVLPVEIGPSS